MLPAPDPAPALPAPEERTIDPPTGDIVGPLEQSDRQLRRGGPKPGPDDHKVRPKPVIDGEATVVPPAPKSECPSWLRPVLKAEKRVDDGPTVSNTRLPKSDAAGPRRRGRSGWSLSTPTANSPRFISAKAASCAEPTCLRRPSRPCCGAIERS